MCRSDLKMSSDTNMTNSYVQDWALSSTGTGMTPFLMGTEDITDPAETNPFETSFAPKSAQEASLLSANTAAANPPKRMLSPGAEQSTVKPDLKQLKRPQLNDLSRFDSSITQSTASKTSATAGSAQGTDASVSPASDVGYRASESDSDQVAGVSSRSSSSQARSSESSNTNARRPYQGFGSSFDVGGTEDISSQSFQDMIQGYASQSQYIQNMPRAMEAPPPFGPARAQTQPSPLSLPPGEVSSEQQPPSSKTTTEGEASPLNSNASEPAAPKKQLPARHSKRTKGTEAQAPHPPQPSHAQDQSKVNTARPPQPSNSRLQNKAEEKLDPEEVKRRQFLERNRVAACKSRQKKKEWVKQLES